MSCSCLRSLSGFPDWSTRNNTASGPGKLVLVADDSSMTRLTVTEIIKQMGHSIIEATNGVEAIVAAKSNPPDLIILDVNMPEKSGRVESG